MTEDSAPYARVKRDGHGARRGCSWAMGTLADRLTPLDQGLADELREVLEGEPPVRASFSS